MTPPEVIVIFGASGDLVRKMILPALYRLEEQRIIQQRIIGVALESWDAEHFAAHASRALMSALGQVDARVEARLLSRLSYMTGDYTSPDTFARLAKLVQSGETCLHYLAIPPSLFEIVVSGLGGAGLAESSRLLVEKPFGRDLESARQLNRVLHATVDETAVYRIDHFLGKEPVENLLAFRYANPIFDAVWNRHYIDHIQVSMAESFGIEERGALYETLGVVRDVVQNHLMQVVCLLTMEAPIGPTADAFADDRIRVLKNVRTSIPPTSRTVSMPGIAPPTVWRRIRESPHSLHSHSTSIRRDGTESPSISGPARPWRPPPRLR